MGDIGSTHIRDESGGLTQREVRDARKALRAKFQLILFVLAVPEILLGTTLACVLFVPKGAMIASRVDMLVTVFINFAITIGALIVTGAWTEDAFNKIDKKSPSQES